MGRPSLFATTRQFLDDLGLASLDELPPLDGSDLQESALGRLDFEALSASLPGMAEEDAVHTAEAAAETPGETAAPARATGADAAMIACNSAPEALRPFIFQLPAISGRFRADMIASPSK